ncbi:hypothetical protein DQ393_17365 [Rhizobium tropici]|uniref:Uncharacterized protein n=1 Tax=Rhizobium tropici TaxID=398 RepID=A0A329YAM1_RHITR|nr:hypothetical protein DQ393_17365 [Rhizobium tropici]
MLNSFWMFSPSIFWNGLGAKRSGCKSHALLGGADKGLAQQTEVAISCAALNRMLGCARPKSVPPKLAIA